MALTDRGFRDINAHLRAIADASPLIRPSNAFFLHMDNDSGWNRQVYHEALDKIIAQGRRRGSADSPVGGTVNVAVLDPDFFAGSKLEQAAVSTGPTIFWAGQVNDSNIQRLYGAPNADAGTDIDELSTINMSIIASNVYSPITLTGGDVASNLPGGWATLVEGSNRKPSFLFFEGMTEGGFDDVAGGAGAYPKGVALMQVDKATLSVAQDKDTAFIWIDLDTSDCVGSMEIPGEASTTGLGQFEEPQIAGDSFLWSIIYFDRDTGSTFGRPKGELIIFSKPVFSSGLGKIYVRRVDFNPYGVVGGTIRTHNEITFTSRIEFQVTPVAKPTATMIGDPGLTFAENSPSADTILRSAGSWITDGFKDDMGIEIADASLPANDSPPARTIDADPTATLLTVKTTDDFDDEGPTTGVTLTGTSRAVVEFQTNHFPVWRSKSRRVVYLQGKDGGISAAAPLVGLDFFARSFNLEAAVAGITQPAPKSVPRTADTIEFESIVFGTIGELVAGQAVSFTLKRVSTRAEALTGAFTIASTSPVANFPIDVNLANDPEGTLIVTKVGGAGAGVLIEGTDYTVVRSTGVITWVVDHSDATSMLADYDHRENEVDPGVVAPVGELLNSTGRSDIAGRVIARVRVADDDSLVDQGDVLTVADV